jgi:hypothetical protein
MDDPIADIAAYGHYSVMKLASDHGIKVYRQASTYLFTLQIITIRNLVS